MQSTSNQSHSVNRFDGINLTQLVSHSMLSFDEVSHILAVIITLDKEFDGPQFAQPAIKLDTFTWQVPFRFNQVWHCFTFEPSRLNTDELASFVAQIKLTYG